MRVLISDNLAPVGVDILRNAGLEVDFRTGLSPDEIDLHPSRVPPSSNR